jgi:hypothetical protein
MESLGEYLRRERERRGMALDDIARVTRVRRQHLEAIEQDRHDLLPAPPFVRGFLSAYAKQIGVAADEVLARYQAVVSGAGSSDASSGTAGQDAGHDASSALPGTSPATAGPAAAATAGRPAGYGHAATVLSTGSRPVHQGVLALAGLVALAALAVVGSILARPAVPPARPPEHAAAPSADAGAAASPAVENVAVTEPAPAAPVSTNAAADTATGHRGATPDASVAALPAADARPTGGAAVGVTPPAGRAPAVAVKPAATSPAPAVAVKPAATSPAPAVAVKPAVTSPAPAVAVKPAATSPAPAVTVKPAATSPAPPLDVAPARLSTLAAVATEETWVQVTIDGGQSVEALLRPGERASWRGGRFDIVVGNAGGVTIELDGVIQPPLGDSGQKASLTLPRSPSQ